ncbi:MAG: hypothetical protein K0S71_330 [Clostridia bacterium]|jgi:hypothetical protein|nr:hypothetical protein [Clostridia bacterium]
MSKHKDNSKQFLAELDRALQSAMQDVVNDLARTSSGAAPIDRGVLQGSYDKEVKKVGGRYAGTVKYIVKENGFNYASYMHEGTYKLGKSSLQKGSVRGMSGKSYKVGNKFLTRVIDGEHRAYTEHVSKVIKKVTDKFRGK